MMMMRMMILICSFLTRWQTFKYITIQRNRKRDLVTPDVLSLEILRLRDD